jgi:hypothetical protein
MLKYIDCTAIVDLDYPKDRGQTMADIALKDFVSETLKEIVAGVKEAQKIAKDEGAVINPILDTLTAKMKYDSAEVVDFDVAVTASSKEKARGGISVLLAPVGLGAGYEAGEEFTSVSRVKFSVKVFFTKTVRRH